MKEDKNLSQSVDWFRQASPYINAHRGKTFVISLSGDSVASEEFSSLIHDLALLSHLGIKLVLVYGIRAQLEKRETGNEVNSQLVSGIRVTDDETLRSVKEIAGSVRVEIESLFSSSLRNTPMSGARLSIVSGNFVTARPYGIHDGIDFCHTGVVRRVHSRAINKQLELGNIVLLSPLGYSTTGETFNLFSEDVATQVAIEIQAQKLVFFLDKPVHFRATLTELRETTPQELEKLIDSDSLSIQSQPEYLNSSIKACRQGIKRIHLLDRHIDGALLKEFFTRDGVGAMVSADDYDDVRTATIKDVGGIIELIAPLEENGTLVRRSREQLELEVRNYSIVERDGTVIACAALYVINNFAELACVVTHPDYRNSGRAEKLMEHLEQRASELGLQALFVFTTRTKHWFIEQGFKPSKLSDIPQARQSSYNYQRNSSILIKPLTANGQMLCENTLSEHKQ